MSSDFYLLINQEKTGPFSYSQMAAMIQNKEVAADAACSTEPSGGWKTVVDYFPWAGARAEARTFPLEQPSHTITHAPKIFFSIGAVLLFWFWWWYPWYIHNSDPSSIYKPMEMADHFARIEGFIVAVGFMIIGAILSLRTNRI